MNNQSFSGTIEHLFGLHSEIRWRGVRLESVSEDKGIGHPSWLVSRLEIVLDRTRYIGLEGRYFRFE